MARVVQSSQCGWARVPEITAAVRPHELHRAVRRWQAGHHGRPVIRDVPQGFSSPQIEQEAVGKDGQVIGRFSPDTTADDAGLRAAIDAALAA